MTETERKLLDAVLNGAALNVAEDPHYYSPFRELTDAVLQERMPPEFERTLADIADRFVTAQDALWEYAQKHPLGRKMAGELLTKARKARGIEP